MHYKEKEYEKRKNLLVLPSCFINKFFCLVECACCTTKQNALQKKWVQEELYFTKKYLLCKVPFSVHAYYIIFSLDSYKQFLEEDLPGLISSVPSCAILYLGTWSSVSRFYASRWTVMNLWSALYLKAVLILLLMILLFFFLFVVQGGLKEEQYFLSGDMFYVYLHFTKIWAFPFQIFSV